MYLFKKYNGDSQLSKNLNQIYDIYSKNNIEINIGNKVKLKHSLFNYTEINSFEQSILYTSNNIFIVCEKFQDNNGWLSYIDNVNDLNIYEKV